MRDLNDSEQPNKKCDDAKRKRKKAKAFPALTPKKLEFWRSEAARLQTEVDAGNVPAFWKLARLYEDGRGVDRNWKRAFELRSRAADAGDPDGLTWVGYSYDYGIGAAYNPAASFKYYYAALKSKTFESRGFALAGVGWAYFNGEGTAVDKKKAFEAFWEARDSGVGFVYMGLSDYYRSGCIVELDERQADFWASKAAAVWFRDAALGNAVALDYLAGLYAEGRGVELNAEKAFKMSATSAKVGFGWAAYHLGLQYEFVRENLKKAFDFYRKGAEKGLPEAYFRVGLAFLTGSGTKVNLREAFRAFQKSANLDFSYGLFWLGRCYWEGWGRRRDEKRAVDCWRRSADAGCMAAQNQYAEYLENDGATKNGGKVDWNEATRYRLAAAEQGVPEAQLAVGYAFNNGLGVERDEKKAVFWYRQAAEIGELPGAKYNLSICLEEGEGVERDPDNAARLMNEAANDGWAPAQNAVAIKLFSGDDGERDENRAAKLFGDAAAQGYFPAITSLAKCFEVGAGVEKNPVAAEFFLRLAAENDPFAAGVLGERFADGEEGIEVNSDFAAYWLQKSADGGSSDGARRLAFCFWEGDGVQQDRAKAVEYWTRAALTGDFDALEELTRAKAAKAVASIFNAGSSFDAEPRTAATAKPAPRRRALKKDSNAL